MNGVVFVEMSRHSKDTLIKFLMVLQAFISFGTMLALGCCVVAGLVGLFMAIVETVKALSNGHVGQAVDRRNERQRHLVEIENEMNKHAENMAVIEELERNLVILAEHCNDQKSNRFIELCQVTNKLATMTNNKKKMMYSIIFCLIAICALLILVPVLQHFLMNMMQNFGTICISMIVGNAISNPFVHQFFRNAYEALKRKNNRT